jgi:hypothetical protein
LTLDSTYRSDCGFNIHSLQQNTPRPPSETKEQITANFTSFHNPISVQKSQEPPVVALFQVDLGHSALRLSTPSTSHFASE